MHLVDCHTHTCCSPDSTARLEDMAASARQTGLTELCTTDHCDLQQEDGSALVSWDWSPVLDQYQAVNAALHWPDFHLLLGLELGGAHTNPKLADEILSGAPLDFVIGSVHNLSPRAGGKDFFFLDYPTEEVCRTVLDDYFSSLLALAPLPYYDTLGHIIYPLRYTNGRAGQKITLDPWSDQLDMLLSTVIHTGRAIEVNTHAGREIADWRPILERYRALGGEYITVGSDAHNPPHVGKGIPQSLELLRETGFRWLTVYRQRRPEQIKLY
ncbi:MAG: PHP domain-containing protein [Lawsonibacter sp.]